MGYWRVILVCWLFSSICSFELFKGEVKLLSKLFGQMFVKLERLGIVNFKRIWLHVVVSYVKLTLK